MYPSVLRMWHIIIFIALQIFVALLLLLLLLYAIVQMNTKGRKNVKQKYFTTLPFKNFTQTISFFIRVIQILMKKWVFFKHNCVEWNSTQLPVLAHISRTFLSVWCVWCTACECKRQHTHTNTSILCHTRCIRRKVHTKMRKNCQMLKVSLHAVDSGIFFIVVHATSSPHKHIVQRVMRWKYLWNTDEDNSVHFLPSWVRYNKLPEVTPRESTVCLPLDNGKSISNVVILLFLHGRLITLCVLLRVVNVRICW